MLGFYLFRAACTSCNTSTFIASATLHLLQLVRSRAYALHRVEQMAAAATLPAAGG